MGVFLGGVGWAIIENFYKVNEKTESFSWLGGIAILLLLFILYRNKLQFSGWYKGNGRKKLPKIVSSLLICSSIILLLFPLVLGFLSS